MKRRKLEENKGGWRDSARPNEGCAIQPKRAFSYDVRESVMGRVADGYDESIALKSMTGRSLKGLTIRLRVVGVRRRRKRERVGGRGRSVATRMRVVQQASRSSLDDSLTGDPGSTLEAGLTTEGSQMGAELFPHAGYHAETRSLVDSIAIVTTRRAIASCDVHPNSLVVVCQPSLLSSLAEGASLLHCSTSIPPLAPSRATGRLNAIEERLTRWPRPLSIGSFPQSTSPEL